MKETRIDKTVAKEMNKETNKIMNREKKREKMTKKIDELVVEEENFDGEVFEVNVEGIDKELVSEAGVKNKKLNSMKKKFTIGEEISNAITHGIGSLLGIVALVLLMVKGGAQRDALYVVSMAIYGVTLILLYSNSAIYHGLTNKRAKYIFEKLDHLSVYLLIAGTYTPYMLVAVGGTKGIVICCIQWALALTGIVLNIGWMERFQKLHLAIYLAMGWMILMLWNDISIALTMDGARLLILGGVAYSVGVLFYAFRWFKHHHMVWHLLVLAGSVLHFFSLYLYV